jgi:hypothetical protein
MSIILIVIAVGVVSVGLSYLMLTSPERSAVNKEAAYQNRLHRAFIVDGKELQSTEIVTHSEVLRAKLYQKALVSPDPWCKPRG